ncbi:MAG: TetR/AcrR family transcriptional regulator [Lachnospiraceae bacterium]|jgi:AcrR family transcriptional regulator|nr:TetR/AcrR family transcriptional regulator [Lachnospiraceae bacterium]
MKQENKDLTEEKNTSNFENIGDQTAAMFISTATEMIDEVGYDNLSIRKIADRTGYHNSTIYLHFKDFNELLMLASMKHFAAYSDKLEKLSKEDLSGKDEFLSIWEVWTDSSLKYPEVFYNFFFGKHSNNLEKVMKRYYEIFPEESHIYANEIEHMYFGNDISTRSKNILNLIKDNNSGVNDNNIDMINEIIISFCKYKLEQKCKNSKLDADELKRQIMDMIHYVCKI